MTKSQPPDRRGDTHADPAADSPGIAGAMQAAQRTVAALDQLEIGVVLVDRAGRPCFVNASAELTLREGDGLTLGAAGLAAGSPSDTRALHELIGAATLGEVVNRRSAWRLSLARPSMRRPLGVRAAALDGAVAERGWSTAIPSAALFIADPERNRRVDPQPLTASYGLTQREAGIAALLAEGASIATIAAALGIAVASARSYLKRAYAKTGTGGQAALVALVLRSQS